MSNTQASEHHSPGHIRASSDDNILVQKTSQTKQVDQELQSPEIIQVSGKQKRGHPCCTGLSSWLWYLSMRIFMVLLLLVPGFVDLSQTHSSGIPRGNFATEGTFYIYDYTLMFWSVFTAVAFIVYHLCQGFVYALPIALTFIVQSSVAPVTKHFDTIIDHIRYLKGYIGTSLFLILLIISQSILFAREIQNQAAWIISFMNIVASLLVVNILVFLEKLFVQIVAIRFHRRAYEDRIQKMHFCTDAITKLAIEARKILRDKERIIQVMKIKKPRQGKVKDYLETSAPAGNARGWNVQLQIPNIIKKQPKRIEPLSSIEADIDKLSEDPANIIMNEDTVRSAVSIDLSKLEVKSIISETEHSIRSMSSPQSQSPSNMAAKERFSNMARTVILNSNLAPYDSRIVGKIIHEALCLETTKLLAEHGRERAKAVLEATKDKTRPEEGCLLIEDIAPFFNTFDAQRVFEMFDEDQNGYITKQELKGTIMNLEKEKKGISKSLRDVGSAVGTLDNLLLVISLLVSLLIILVIFGIPLYSFLLTSVSLLVAVTFIFGNSAKTMFEGIIFLFITHPFDVGDRVFIDNFNYIVHEIGIITTTFRRWDGQLILSPNSILLTKNIVNVRRSPNMMEIVELHVHVKTPNEKLNALKTRMLNWLQSESRNYIPAFELNVMGVENMNKMTIQIFLEHRDNWQDGEKRWERHNKFLIKLKDVLDELKISYKYPVQPVRLIDREP